MQRRNRKALLIDFCLPLLLAHHSVLQCSGRIGIIGRTRPVPEQQADQTSILTVYRREGVGIDRSGVGGEGEEGGREAI